MNRKLAAVLSAVAVLGLFACGRPPAPAANTEPVTQPSAQPFVAASSGCPASAATWCPAPKTIKLGAMQIELGGGWIARDLSDYDVELARSGGYDTALVSDQIALVATNPGVPVADLLRGLIRTNVIDLTREPDPAAALGFETAAYSYADDYGRRCYDVLMIQGDHALYTMSCASYPPLDAGLYELNARLIAPSVKLA